MEARGYIHTKFAAYNFSLSRKMAEMQPRCMAALFPHTSIGGKKSCLRPDPYPLPDLVPTFCSVSDSISEDLEHKVKRVYHETFVEYPKLCTRYS